MIKFVQEMIKDLIQLWIKRLFTRYHPCSVATIFTEVGLFPKVHRLIGLGRYPSTTNARWQGPEFLGHGSSQTSGDSNLAGESPAKFE